MYDTEVRGETDQSSGRQGLLWAAYQCRGSWKDRGSHTACEQGIYSTLRCLRSGRLGRKAGIMGPSAAEKTPDSVH